MIFNTITNDLNGAINKIGIFNRSFADLKNAISANGIKGLFNSISPAITSNDISLIKEYNRLVGVEGVSSQSAWYRTMLSSSRSAQALFDDENNLIRTNNGLILSEEALTRATNTMTIGAKAASVAFKALSIAGNIIAFTAIIKGIELVVRGFDNWIHRVEKANEAMNEAVGEYESAKSSLESVNSELEEQNKQLDELLSKDKLTYAEKGQLEELQAITQELLLQQDIEERRADKASKEAADKAVDAYEKQYGRYDKTEEDLQEKLSYENFPIPEDANDVIGMIAAYIRAQELLEQSQKEFDEAVKNSEDTTWLAEDIQYNIDAVDDYRQALDENISDLQEKRLALEDEYNKAIEKRESGIEPLTSSEKDVIETYESIYDVMRMVYEYTDKNTWKSMQIESVFDAEGIEKTKEELIEMVKAGEFDESTLQSYPKLSAALEQNKVSASELRNELEALVDAEGNVKGDTFNDKYPISSTITSSIEQIATQLEPQFAKLGDAYKDIFTADGFTLEAVDNSMLEDLRKSFAEIEDEIGVTFDATQLENFFAVLSNSNSTAEQTQEAFNNIATSYLYSTDVLESLNSATVDSIAKQLESLGVVNASEVATEALAAKEEYLAFARREHVDETGNLVNVTQDLANATADDINVLIAEQGALEGEGIALDEATQKMIAYWIQKQAANGQLSTVGDIQQLGALCEALGVSSKALRNYIYFKQLASMTDVYDAASIERFSANAEKNMEQAQADIQAIYGKLGGAEINFAAPNTSKKSGSSSKSEKDTTKEFDWIEQAIENVEKEVKSLDDVVNSAYSTFSQKNEALAKEIGKVSEEIDLQQQAYEGYMRKADSIGLSDHYKGLVQSGAINIEEIKDENLQKQIDAYQKWYDKAQNASDAIKQLKTDMKDLYVNAYELQTDNLKERLDSDSITQKQYLEGLKAAYEQFYGNLEDYAQQYHEAVLEYLDEEKGYLNDVAGAAASLLDREIDNVRDDADEQENRLKKQIDLLEDRKKPLEDELDALEDKAKREEQIFNLQKAQYALAKAEYQRPKLVNYMPDTIVI